MTKHNFTDHPKIPPSKAFRPITQVLIAAANAISHTDCAERARTACAEVEPCLASRPSEESDGKNPTALRFARLRFDQERRHVEVLRDHVVKFTSAPDPQGEAARVVLASIDLVLNELAAARATAPELPDETKARLPSLELPELPRPNYAALLDTTRHDGR